MDPEYPKRTKIKFKEPMKLYCDNKTVITIAHNPVQYDRTKHVEVDRHFIEKKLEADIICTPFITSKNQLTDILTKRVDSAIFHTISSKLGLEDYSPT